jgi:radical SAM superfamily enzyme YgiQ (UPF0313 family)
MDSAFKAAMAPPLSLLVLGALTPNQHSVTVIDENVQHLKLHDTPDCVGITVKVDTLPQAELIASHYRARGIPVIMGGIHPTACPEDCIKHADSVVVGEAETIWPKLLEDLQNNRLQKVYRNSEPPDMNKIPIPRYELINQQRYLFTNTIRIGRGCPWRCDFCYNSSPNIENRYRTKSIPQIMREIENLGTDHVMFIDDNFIGNPTFTRQLLPKLADMNLTWHAAVSADINRHQGLIADMAASGCKSLFIGFESINANSLKCCHKVQNKAERYNQLVEEIHANNMMINASLVFGFDSDDETVFDSSLQWLIEHKIATMTAHILTPYPGTRLYTDLLKQGRITDHDLSHYNTSQVVFRPAGMSARTLEQGYRSIYRNFYSWKSILQRMPDTSTQRLAYLQFALFYRKFGKITSLAGKAMGMRRMAQLARRIAYPSRRTPQKSPSPLRPISVC